MGLYRYRIQDEGFDPFKEYEFFFQSFLYYAAETNKFIQREIENERARYEEYMRLAVDDPDEIREDFMYELDLKTKEGMADIYFDSLIIALYSFIEKKMLQLCRYFETRQAFKVNEILGDGILKYRKYLERAANMDFVEIKEEWEQLTHFKKMRNILVHSDGVRIIPANEKGLILFLKGQPGIKLVESPDGTVFHFEDAGLIFYFHRCSKFIVNYLFHEKVPW